MELDPHDQTALSHYLALIAAHYPPHLAAMLAAARYQAMLVAGQAPPPLPLFREMISITKDSNPRLRRTAGRLLVEVEEAMGLTR
jgi:hypothetical protein